MPVGLSPKPDPEVIRSTALGPGHTITIGSVFVVYIYDVCCQSSVKDTIPSWFSFLSVTKVSPQAL